MIILRRAWKRYALELFFFIFVAVTFFVAGKAFASEPAQVKFLGQKGEQYVIARPAVTTTTTTTTTTFKPVVVESKPRVEAAAPGVVEVGDDIWDRLASCESGQRWDYNGNSGFDGGLQFSPSTWTRMNTYWQMNTGYEFAWQAPREVQIQVAIRLMQVSSGAHSQWPVCSRSIGMPNKF